MRFENTRLRLAVLACLLITLAAAGNSQDVPLRIVLRPAAADAQQRVPWVDVSLTFVAPTTADHGLFRMPLVASNVETVAKTIESLSVTDESGPIETRIKDDPEGGGVPYRHWLSSRATKGQVLVHYRAPITNVLAPRGAAPPLEMRSDGGAFSGVGAAFILLPEADLPWQADVRWELGDMPPGAVGVSCRGKGNFKISATDALESLRNCYFMAGTVGLYPENLPKAGFFSAWHGTAPFDLRQLMTEDEKLYSFYVRFFKRPPEAPYGVFLRENQVNAGGGVSLPNSFVATFGPTTEVDKLQITLAHEMLHTFVGSLASTDELTTSWFAEGMAVYYARLLALRAGEITPSLFLEDLNTTAGRYYTNALMATPNSEIPAGFWADTRIRVLPYDRGSMYFAVVDGEVRAASYGNRSLDDLLFAMLDRRRHNLPMDEAAWVDLVSRELGEKGKAEFQAMLSGATMVPASDGFGPCFTRTTKMLRRYQLGFEPKVLTEQKKIIRGLIPGSAAKRAGLRNGDEITRPVPQDQLQGEQDGILTLELLRDGKVFKISYKPRAEAVEAYQWMRTGNLPDSACGY